MGVKEHVVCAEEPLYIDISFYFFSATTLLKILEDNKIEVLSLILLKEMKPLIKIYIK